MPGLFRLDFFKVQAHELVLIYISLLAESHLFLTSSFQVPSINSVTTKIYGLMLLFDFCVFVLMEE